MFKIKFNYNIKIFQRKFYFFFKYLIDKNKNLITIKYYNFLKIFYKSIKKNKKFLIRKNINDQTFLKYTINIIQKKSFLASKKLFQIYFIILKDINRLSINILLEHLRKLKKKKKIHTIIKKKDIYNVNNHNKLKNLLILGKNKILKNENIKNIDLKILSIKEIFKNSLQIIKNQDEFVYKNNMNKNFIKILKFLVFTQNNMMYN